MSQMEQGRRVDVRKALQWHQLTSKNYYCDFVTLSPFKYPLSRIETHPYT